MLSEFQLAQVNAHLQSAYEILREGVALDHPLQCTAEHILFCADDVKAESDLAGLSNFFQYGGGIGLRPLAPDELFLAQGFPFPSEAQVTPRPFNGPRKG